MKGDGGVWNGETRGGYWVEQGEVPTKENVS